jgi:hypothetical protein
MRIEDIKLPDVCCLNCRFWNSDNESHGICLWTDRCLISLPDWLKGYSRFTFGHHGKRCEVFLPK